MCSNLYRPHHVAPQALDAPQYTAFVANGLMNVYADDRRQAVKETEASLNLILDGIIQDKELCKLYFGELWCSELENRLQQFHSPKKAYGYKHECFVDPSVIESSFTVSQQEFKDYIHNEIRQLQQKIQNRNKQRTQVKTQTKETVNEDPALTQIKEALSTKKRLLNKLKPNPRENKELIAKLEQQIASLEEQKQSLTTQLKEEVQEYDPAQLEAAQKEIKKLEGIIQGIDNKSKFFQSHKQEFIAYRILPILASQEYKGIVAYDKQEYKQQQRIVTWVKNTLESHKISIDSNTSGSFSVKLQARIAGAVNMLTTMSNLKEHLLNLVLELAQILYLEEILNELYPDKNIKVYKPPCVDDIKAHTDCVIRVKNDQRKTMSYIPVDLKNSSNEEYLMQEEGLGTKGALHGLHYCLGLEGEPEQTESYIISIHPAITNILLNQIIHLVTHDIALPKKLSSLLTPQEYSKTVAAGHTRIPYSDAVSAFRKSIQQLLGDQSKETLN